MRDEVVEWVKARHLDSHDPEAVQRSRLHSIWEIVNKVSHYLVSGEAHDHEADFWPANRTPERDPQHRRSQTRALTSPALSGRAHGREDATPKHIQGHAAQQLIRHFEGPRCRLH